MPRIKCETCDDSFVASRKKDKAGAPRLRRFCSRDCYQEAVKRAEKNCAQCTGLIPETSWHHEAVYCSRACHDKARDERAHGVSWKGGRSVDKDGYVRVWSPDHPLARKDGYASEHRVAMSVAIGRTLENHEVVHHINGDRQDNRLENLMLFSSQSEHMRHHAELAGT